MKNKANDNDQHIIERCPKLEGGSGGEICGMALFTIGLNCGSSSWLSCGVDTINGCFSFSIFSLLLLLVD